ncbi:extracellular solute-binding protein [Alicyclobacillus mengziensis]|uniref:Substrate-binding domain-containing protein n=1 Tax=Alicyclobacillus mengziensis TaxID=2931921 RepID=A0A9X7Z743_9BACL|nr:extracellular solute-binding protein [Alicyclobacillus mengziensis]QSO46925.1 substrate-binding domain-containing protein [Alicyclobacillus mengziensis]
MNKIFLNEALKYFSIGSVVASLMAITGCGTGNASNSSSNHTSSNSTSVSSAAKKTEIANVAYAGSLQLVNDEFAGPTFTKATGLKYQGRGGGAFGVANLIQSGEITPNVFESMGTAPFEQMGSKKPTWAIGFASSPIVIAYSPNSPYASKLKAIASGKLPLTELFSLMEQPGFHLGRTNPNTDPQGQAFVLMMQLAQKQLHLPAGTASKILGSNTNPKQIFAEEAILSRLQSGQLDASSAYLSEAIQKHLPYISLPASMNMGDPTYQSIYSSVHMDVNGKTVSGSPIEIYITTVPGNPNQIAGEKFVSFLLSKQGLDIYQQNGYTLTKFLTWGNKADIPSSIRTEIQG